MLSQPPVIIMVKLKGLAKEKEKIRDMLAQVRTLKSQSATNSQNIQAHIIAPKLSKKVQVQTELTQTVQDPVSKPPKIKVFHVNAMEEYEITVDPIMIEEYKGSNIKSLEEEINHKIDKLVDMEGELNKGKDDIYDIKR